MSKRKIHAKDYSPYYFTLCKKWPAALTSKPSQVTCKNCLRILRKKG